MEFVVETSDDGRLKAVEVSGPNGQPVMVRSTLDRHSSRPIPILQCHFPIECQMKCPEHVLVHFR